MNDAGTDRRASDLRRRLQNAQLGLPLYFFAEIGSTSDFLKRQAEAGAPEGATAVADAQTRGRGRAGRQWLSLPGMGVYASVLLRPPWLARDAAALGMLAALSVFRCLRGVGVPELRLKWPNDVLVRSRKIAGVLAETRLAGPRIEFAVLGFGLNVKHDAAALSCLGENRATSCAIEGVDLACDDVLVILLRELEQCYVAASECGAECVVARWIEAAGRHAAQAP